MAIAAVPPFLLRLHIATTRQLGLQIVKNSQVISLTSEPACPFGRAVACLAPKDL